MTRFPKQLTYLFIVCIVIIAVGQNFDAIVNWLGALLK